MGVVGSQATPSFHIVATMALMALDVILLIFLTFVKGSYAESQRTT